jgi:hypothetical protein
MYDNLVYVKSRTMQVLCQLHTFPVRSLSIPVLFTHPTGSSGRRGMDISVYQRTQFFQISSTGLCSLHACNFFKIQLQNSVPYTHAYPM